MAFIDINNLQAIQALAKGEFALPTIVGNPNLLLTDTPRLRSSIKGMQTVMARNAVGLGQITALIDVANGRGLPQQVQDLEQRTLGKMRDYLRNPNQVLLAEIFHMVQLWGGRAGRNIYVMNQGFAANWNPAAYQQFVEASARVAPVAWPGPDPRVPLLIAAADQINQFGVAFATKHARFWAQAAMAQPLPIFDRIMALGSMGIRPHWNDYARYISEMAAHARQANMDVATLERDAFAQFDTPAGEAWLEARKT
jgi:hypothetical protein